MITPSSATLAIVIVTAVFAFGPAAAAEEGAFVSGVEDLPLMPGLSELAEGRMVFDTPSGRIVESYASGEATRSQVLEFYAATLPQLGWRRDGPAAFSREGEILKLEFPSGGQGLTVLFSLSPSKAE